ncbi:MAG: ProQ/FinO family protein [Motiliproteus sp.]
MTQTPSVKPSKNKNRVANQAAVALISELYPDTFNRDAVKPLKIGIQEDLLAEQKLPQGKIKRALASYVRAPQYYKSLVTDADRVDLKGEPAGKVSEEEAAHAQAMLKKIREQRQVRAEDERLRIREEKQRQHKERIEAKAARAEAKTERINDKLSQLLNKHS